MNLDEKKQKLELSLEQYQSLLVAFSGGADSALLLAVAHDVLKERVLAVTGTSRIHPAGELEGALAFTEKRGIRHITTVSYEMTLPDFIKNTPDRCYICKKSLMAKLKKISAENGISAIAHGANVDDLNDYRPGFRAAQEMGVISPLIDAGMTKSDIRALSRQMKLETWDKPAQPCLATRIPYGVAITEKGLRVIESAEQVLADMGISGHRVRHHGEIARIELPQQFFDILVSAKNRAKVTAALHEIGYLYVCLDLEGYAQGRMNRALSREE